MAVTNCMLTGPEHQQARPEHESPAVQMDRCLMVMNIAERLPIMSGGIVDDAREGESYELLVRRLDSLHHQLQSLAALAKAAKVVRL